MTLPPLSIKDKNYTRLVFLHMRKAGGTSIANFLKNVVKSNKTSFREFSHCEGKKKCLGLHIDLVEHYMLHIYVNQYQELYQIINMIKDGIVRINYQE